MTILCTLFALFQLIILTSLLGILVSVAALTRLMEVAIALIQPASCLLLRQCTRLIIWLTIMTMGLTCRVFTKMCSGEECTGQLVIGMRMPSMPFRRRNGPDFDESEGQTGDTFPTEIETAIGSQQFGAQDAQSDRGSQPASARPSERASQPASARASQPASARASERASERVSQPASERASERRVESGGEDVMSEREDPTAPDSDNTSAVTAEAT